MSNGGGLKQQWGVDDPAKAGSDQQSQQFKASFEKEIAAISGHLTYTATNAEAARHNPLAARRDALYPSFQSALGQIDRTNPAKAKGSIDKVLTDEKALSGEVAKFRKEAEKARTDWQARQPKFDAAVQQVEALEAWGDTKAPALRPLVDGIRTQVNDRKFAQACTVVDQLLPKLKPIYDEYLKQKEAQKKYQSALEALQPKLTEASVSRYAKLKPMQDDMAAIHTQMETAAQSKNFVQALKIVTDLAVKVDIYAKALAELEKQKKAYEDALAPLQPRLTTGPQPHAKLEPMHQEINAARGKMEEAAQKGEFVQALQLAKDLSVKLGVYEKALAELEKQKKAYEDALAPLKEKLSKAAESKYAKLEAKKKDIATVQGQMEAAAQSQDYVKALQVLKDLSAKVEAFGTALAELERKKKAYEDALAPLKEKLSKASEPRDGKLSPLQTEIGALQKEMETAATNGEYEQALKSCGKLPAKLDAYAKEAAASGAVGVTVGGEFQFAEHPLGKPLKIAKYAEFTVKVGSSVKFGFSKAEGEKKGLSKSEAEAGARPIVAQLWEKAKWDVGGGPKYNNKDKSLSLAASATFSTEWGPAKGEFTPIEISLVNWDKKKGITGPKVGLLNFTASLAKKCPIKGVDVEIAITASIAGELTPNYAGIGEWVLEKLAIETAEGAIAVDAAAVASAAAAVAIPLAAAAAIGYGMYQEVKNMKADSEAIQTALQARKKATQFAESYARTITGASGGGGEGSQLAEKDLAQIMSKTNATREQATEAVKKAQGGYEAIRARELKKLKDKMYGDAVLHFDEGHKDDFGFIENRGETWGFRGTFRKRLRMILYADD